MERLSHLTPEKSGHHCHQSGLDVQLMDTLCHCPHNRQLRQSCPSLCQLSTSGSRKTWSPQTFQHFIAVTMSILIFLFILSPVAVSCEDAVNLCAGNQCMNNSTCVNSTYDYTCSCAGTQYTGWYCNVSIFQDCSSSPCQNGKCQNITMNNNNNTTSFNCTCQPGFEGPLCEKVINYCNKDGIKCANNGSCQNHPEYQNYTCSCATGYEGTNCTNKISKCLFVECRNGGTCIDGGESYTCKCKVGFNGTKCENQYDPCINASICQHGNCLNGVCNCTDSGWQGDHCEQLVNECEENVNTCLHGANCTDLEWGFDCNCTQGYSGKTCETANCTGIDCSNNGTCEIHNSTWSCKCAEFIEGAFCEIKGPCFDRPCQNAKACHQSIKNNTYTCDCNEGWKGVNCSDDIDECSETSLQWRHKCKNGTCQNTQGSYNCSCFPGYTGQFCEIDINECQSNPCQHGGICSDLVNNFTCDCSRTGYEGQDCSHNINECSLNETLCNKGVCTDQEPFFSCNCGENYLGDRCQFDNPCVNFTCLNGGQCHLRNETDSHYFGSCSCSENYEGVSCEKSPSTKDTDLGIIIGPIVGGIVLIIIVIVAILFIMTARSKRATRGTYSPSQQETSGSRVELGNVLKKPPEERLI
ncbi:hypothetical protein Btru_057139 [Bulinus truncatus]|nr:hypothetical protein Btru_057139 [Bulinus truncatus]